MNFIVKYDGFVIIICVLVNLLALKLALEHNSIKASMGGENSMCDFTDKVHIKEHRYNISFP